MSETTIFQKIVARDIPSTIVYEDDIFLAFLDISPVSKGHTLLITKDMYRWMHEVPDDTLQASFLLTKKMMKAMIAGLGCEFVQIGVVGKDVPHFHIHLIPRVMDDNVSEFYSLTKYEDGEAQIYADKIKTALEI